jgi:DNA-binding transcriptional ArsR family regulator
VSAGETGDVGSLHPVSAMASGMTRLIDQRCALIGFIEFSRFESLAVISSSDDAVATEIVRHIVPLGHPLARHEPSPYILNHMVQYNPNRLDASFVAISHPTRRGVLEQLGRADASITDLAEKFDMTLTGMKKHVGVLEQAGLVITKKIGRVRTCQLGPRRLDEEAAWLERYRRLWDARFDELDNVVDELTRKERSDGRRNR